MWLYPPWWGPLRLFKPRLNRGLRSNLRLRLKRGLRIKSWAAFQSRPKTPEPHLEFAYSRVLNVAIVFFFFFFFFFFSLFLGRGVFLHSLQLAACNKNFLKQEFSTKYPFTYFLKPVNKISLNVYNHVYNILNIHKVTTLQYFKYPRSYNTTIFRISEQSYTKSPAYDVAALSWIYYIHSISST